MKRMHRLLEARTNQNVSIRTVSRVLGITVDQVKTQEHPSFDLRISELHEWQKVLKIPISELLVEAEGQLSGPVLDRSRMVRLMRTALELRGNPNKDKISALTQMIIDQILEIMPELSEMMF